MGEPDLEKGVPKNPDGEYTIDDGNSKNVENAHSLDPTPNLAELQESQTPPQTPQSSRSAGFTTGEKEIGFREDAKVWHLYLEDAEEKAKYKADLWNTALDSLLIFAGLPASRR
ncbi:hypothetical protein NMY22_g20188 [Coprinellus aureogranulatus]|nr:hypothetical protein NMY22_g20188 [Coprinellus aureogranulatus]